MNIESKDIIEAIGKAHKVDTIEKMFWEFKGSIKQDITAIAERQAKELTASVQHANQLQIEQFKNVLNDAISNNNEKNLKPLREDISTLKSDKKALKWVILAVSGIASTAYNVVKDWFIR